MQAALLAAVSGMPHHHPSTPVLAFRVLAVGAVGGFVAGTVARNGPPRAGAVAGAVTGLGVGAGFWWLVLYGDTVGVFHHVHYALATTVFLVDAGARAPRAVAAAVGLVVAAAFTVGGFVGGRAAAEWP